VKETFYADTAFSIVKAKGSEPGLPGEGTMDTPIGPGATGMELTNIKVCARCGLRYDWRKSPSTLKMTYCGSLCEYGDLGFTVDALLKMERSGAAPAAAEEAPAAV
jgi:hypothetical protein